MAYRQERLEKIIEREISTTLINECKDERLKFVTITNVKLTGDLSLATVYYTIMGNDKQIEATSENLEAAKGFIRSTLSKTLEIRRTPELKFKYDESLEFGNKIDNILKKLDL